MQLAYKNRSISIAEFLNRMTEAIIKAYDVDLTPINLFLTVL